MILLQGGFFASIRQTSSGILLLFQYVCRRLAFALNGYVVCCGIVRFRVVSRSFGLWWLSAFPIISYNVSAFDAIRGLFVAAGRLLFSFAASKLSFAGNKLWFGGSKRWFGRDKRL